MCELHSILRSISEFACCLASTVAIETNRLWIDQTSLFRRPNLKGGCSKISQGDLHHNFVGSLPLGTTMEAWKTYFPLVPRHCKVCHVVIKHLWRHLRINANFCQLADPEMSFRWLLLLTASGNCICQYWWTINKSDTNATKHLIDHPNMYRVSD